MHARLRCPNNLLILHQIINRTWLIPCLADEIVEPRPDININVTAFTESKVLLYNSELWKNSGSQGVENLLAKKYCANLKIIDTNSPWMTLYKDYSNDFVLSKNMPTRWWDQFFLSITGNMYGENIKKIFLLKTAARWIWE